MITVDPNLEGETIVDSFRQCLYRGEAINSNAPGLLKRILRDDYWRRPDKKGKPFTYVEQFITAKPLPGLGSDVASVMRAIRDDPEAVAALDAALQSTPRQGTRTDLNNNVIEVSSAPQGNSRQKAHRKLAQDRPDLHAKVLTGELTAHAAMIEAGYREKTLTIPSDPIKAARRILKHFRGDDLTTLIRELSDKE